MITTSVVDGVADEFRAADLGDSRRTARLVRVAESIERDPSVGFPRSLESEAELEGFYRLINNDGFEASDVLEPHIVSTLARAKQARTVVVIHDTTTVDYSGMSPREGLGITTGRRTQGFLAHASLAVVEETGTPLGLLHLETLTREGTKRRNCSETNHVMRGDSKRESLRWLRGIEDVEGLRNGAFEALHVTDAEGDFFEMLAFLHGRGTRFVIRAGQLDRIVAGRDHEETRLRDIVDGVRARAHREIDLSARKHRENKPKGKARKHRHPERAARVARVALGSCTVTLSKTRYSDVQAEPFEVNVVRVWEPHPVAGEPAVEWVLFTGESVATRAELERVVDLYRRRWTIEEYFKALKTGCALEKRQVESYDALCKVLAILAPIAYRLLLLRAVAQSAPDTPATSIFSSVELTIMAQAPSNRALPPPTTVADALNHLARLGGHLRRNGPPGWQTLGRGYERLLTLRLGWRLAEESRGRCDQS